MQPSIRQRLFLSFFLVLGIMVLMFVVNLIALVRVKGAAGFSQLLDETRQVIAENQNALSNYALSGDPGELVHLRDGNARVKELLLKLQAASPSEDVRTSINDLQSTQSAWADNFAAKVSAKRQQVDMGKATVADLQITYLSLEPARWARDLQDKLNWVERRAAPNQTASGNAIDAALAIAMVVLVIGTLVSLAVGALIAFRTANALASESTDSSPNPHAMRW